MTVLEMESPTILMTHGSPTHRTWQGHIQTDLRDDALTHTPTPHKHCCNWSQTTAHCLHFHPRICCCWIRQHNSNIAILLGQQRQVLWHICNKNYLSPQPLLVSHFANDPPHTPPYICPNHRRPATAASHHPRKLRYVLHKKTKKHVSVMTARSARCSPSLSRTRLYVPHRERSYHTTESMLQHTHLGFNMLHDASQCLLTLPCLQNRSTWLNTIYVFLNHVNTISKQTEITGLNVQT